MQLPPFQLERYFAQYEFNVEYVLCGSDCESVAVADLLALEPDAGARLQRLWLGYTESPGAPPLRQAIASIYDRIDADQVLVHAGAEEAVFLTLHAVLQAGDHVVVQWPCYQSLEDVPRSIGCDVTRWEGRETARWAPDLDELESVLRQRRTRLVIVNAPHNPTGYLPDRAAFDAVLALASAHGALVFSDEVYRECEHDARDRLPAACDLSETAISLGVLSKTYGLPGLRIGWLAARNAEVLRRVAGLKDYTTICCSAPSECLAEIAIRHRWALAERNLGIIRANLESLDAFFTRHEALFTWQRPIAGPIAFPRLLNGDVEEFCAALVRETGVLLLPGTLFAHPHNHFRLGFGRRNLPEALARLDAFVGAGWSG
jgi:aspartate/methionine/tyrosine aminotransferase